MSWPGGARLAALIGLLGCASSQPSLPALELNELPDWSQESAARALPAILSGCRMLLDLPGDQALPGMVPGLIADDWREPCGKLAEAWAEGESVALRGLEHLFVAHLGDGAGVPALVTGYYEPEFDGRRQPDRIYRYPLYRLPDDPGKFDRAEIAQGALDGMGLELLYLRDPVDAFFLQIQGSGRVRLDDGALERVGYAGNNGRDYVAIGKLLVEAGLIAKAEISMQSIRRYLASHPGEAQSWLNRNPRFVFFRLYDGPGPLGAMGTALTPMVSVAADPAFLAMGQPIWLNAQWPADGAGHNAGDSLGVLAVAEDEGGAIKGQGRIDLFWGAGELAEKMAGTMRSQGAYYPIVPRAWLQRRGEAPGS